jgi:hypothetical protein
MSTRTAAGNFLSEAANVFEDDFLVLDEEPWIVLHASAYADTRRITFYLADIDGEERQESFDFDQIVEVV